MGAVLVALCVPATALAGKAYVSNSNIQLGGQGSVSVIDTNTETVQATVPVGQQPGSIVASPDGTRVYVVNENDNSVSVIDTSSDTVVATIPVGSNPDGIAMSPDGSRLYAANLGPDTVSVINTTTNSVVATVPVGADPSSIAVHPNGSRVYVVCGDPGMGALTSVSVIDTQTNNVISTITGFGSGSSNAGRIAITPDGTTGYVVNEDSETVSIFDTATETVAGQTIQLSWAPLAIVFNADGSRAYVTIQNGNSVAVIDTATRTVIGNIATGQTPRGIALNSDGSRAYVVLNGADSVAVIDTEGAAVTGTPTVVGPDPVHVTVVPNQPPAASANATAEAAGSETSFDATGSTDSDGTVARYDWDFGDGTTLADGGPTPIHTYEQAGSYSVTLTVTDDGDCSTALIFTGMTALCNGSPVARFSFEVTVAAKPGSSEPETPANPAQPTDPCANSLSEPLVSTSHWRPLAKRLRLRLRSEAGSYLLASQKRASFILQVRRLGGQRARGLQTAKFYVDGEHLKTDTAAPYLLSIDPLTLDPGHHILKARVSSRAGARQTLKLGFHVANCATGAFSVSLSSKRPGTHPNIDLRARSGGSILDRVDFALSRYLRVENLDSAGMVGRLRLLGPGGTVKTKALRLSRLSGNSVYLAGNNADPRGGSVDLAGQSKLSVRLNRGKSRPKITLRGLKAYSATRATLSLYGKRTQLIRNPNSCKRRHRFTAKLTSTEGQTTKLTRSLKMCKTRR